MKNNNKRNHSGSSPPESPNLTKSDATKHTKKKIFSTPNRFSIFSQDENQDEMLETNSTSPPSDQINVDTSITIKPPPPIFVKGIADFPDVADFKLIFVYVTIKRSLTKTDSERG